MKRRTGRILFATAVAAMALLAPAGTANAGLLSQSAGPCPSYPFSTPFSRWLDPMQYTLAPGGAFESASGLTFTGGARIVAGNESSYVHSTADRNSVLIPRGGTVTTGPICIGIDKLTVRFFARRPNFSLLPLMTVEGVYTTRTGATASLPLVGVPLAGGSWSPQVPFLSAGALLELGDTTMMRFRLRSVVGDWQVDDLYVDPLRRT
ncbi:MAG: hypothetical protein QOD24_812 [Solirubrobacteraceae bacterium]|nr:hypothetical protein [Solirubrobacteraceae bacterium]